MSNLQQQFTTIGIENVPFSQQQQTLLNDYIATLSPRFKSICEQRKDRAPCDLLLGLMTQQYHQAVEQWQLQQSASLKMQQVFTSTIGHDHLDKFYNLDNQMLILITKLWLTVQGANGIDFSYSNEQALSTALMLNNPDNIESLRQGFMQAYYVGKQSTKPVSSNFLTRLFNKFSQ